MGVRRLALPMAIVGTLAVVAPSHAITRYGSPTGSTTDFSPTGCQAAAPCAFYNAVNFASVGDTVVLAGGAYQTVTSTVTVPASTVVQAAPGESPQVTFASANFLSIQASNVTLRGFTLLGSHSAYLVNTGESTTNVLLDRMNIRQSAAGLALIMSQGTTLRDSLVVKSGAAVTANAVEADGVIRNSTIVAQGAGVTNNTAVFRNCGYHTGGTGTYSLQIRNSILRAVGGSGANAGLSVPAPGTCTFNTDVDYSHLTSSSGVTTLGTHNVAAAPSLDAGYQQLAGSSTIDKGAAAVLFAGEFDLFGKPRLSGPAPDIGADEFYVAPSSPPTVVATAPDTTKPVVSALKATKKKGKLKSLGFTSTEAGSATLRFQRRKGKKFKSAGFQTQAAKAGRNSVKPKKLKKGRYRLTVTVKYAAGNVSAIKTLSFSTK